jgi:hypothetical protein
MESAVRTHHYGRVTHYAVAESRSKPCAGDAVPMYAVLAIEKTQTFVGRLMERGEHIQIVAGLIPCTLLIA